MKVRIWPGHPPRRLRAEPEKYGDSALELMQRRISRAVLRAYNQAPRAFRVSGQPPYDVVALDGAGFLYLPLAWLVELVEDAESAVLVHIKLLLTIAVEESGGCVERRVFVPACVLMMLAASDDQATILRDYALRARDKVTLLLDQAHEPESSPVEQAFAM